MDIPSLGQTQNNYNYQIPNDPSVKKKLILFVIGVVVIIIALIIVLTSGGGKPGMEPMRSALTSTTEALGIIDEYEGSVQSADTQNEIALIQILIRGNFQKLNNFYEETFDPKNSFSSSPSVDATSKESLDRSLRNNTLDSDIITELKPKIASAVEQLELAKTGQTKTDAEMIEASIKDLTSVQEILERSR